MAKNNSIAQFINMMERMQTRMEECEKKMELMVNVLQTHIKNTLKGTG